jgi:hypothetical protein
MLVMNPNPRKTRLRLQSLTGELCTLLVLLGIRNPRQPQVPGVCPWHVRRSVSTTNHRHSFTHVRRRPSQTCGKSHCVSAQYRVGRYLTYCGCPALSRGRRRCVETHVQSRSCGCSTTAWYMEFALRRSMPGIPGMKTRQVKRPTSLGGKLARHQKSDDQIPPSERAGERCQDGCALASGPRPRFADGRYRMPAHAPSPIPEASPDFGRRVLITR